MVCISLHWCLWFQCYLEFLSEEFDNLDTRSTYLSQAVGHVTVAFYQGKLHYELANTYFKSGIVELSKGDVCSYAKALKVFADTVMPRWGCTKFFGR